MFKMLSDATEKLKDGGVVAFPTETFYGLGVDPTNANAVSKLLDLKDRAVGEGVPFIVASASLAEQHCDLSDPQIKLKYLALTNKFWPGPLTVVLPINKCSKIDRRLLGAKETVALRHSSNTIATQLAESIGGIIPATSANPHGLPPASDWQMAEKYFADRDVTIVVAETLGAKLPSTLVAISSDGLQLIREGMVPFAEILDAVK